MEDSTKDNHGIPRTRMDRLQENSKLEEGFDSEGSSKEGIVTIHNGDLIGSNENSVFDKKVEKHNTSVAIISETFKHTGNSAASSLLELEDLSATANDQIHLEENKTITSSVIEGPVGSSVITPKPSFSLEQFHAPFTVTFDTDRKEEMQQSGSRTVHWDPDHYEYFGIFNEERAVYSSNETASPTKDNAEGGGRTKYGDVLERKYQIKGRNQIAGTGKTICQEKNTLEVRSVQLLDRTLSPNENQETGNIKPSGSGRIENHIHTRIGFDMMHKILAHGKTRDMDFVDNRTDRVDNGTGCGQVCQQNQMTSANLVGAAASRGNIANPPQQTEPPRVITLQTPALPTILWKKHMSDEELLSPDQSTASANTLPPPYQESLGYPALGMSRPSKYSKEATADVNLAREPPLSFIRIPTSNARAIMFAPLARASLRRQEDIRTLHTNRIEESDDLSQSGFRCPQDNYSDHQILALLSCIMFWPIGLIAIYYANMASILRTEGIYSKSTDFSKRALILSLVAFMIGTAVYLVFYLKGGIRIH